MKISGFVEIIKGRKKAKVRFDIWNSTYEVNHNFAEKVLEIFTKYEKPRGIDNFLVGKTYGAFVLPKELAEEFAQQLKDLLEDANNLTPLIEVREVKNHENQGNNPRIKP